jgi:putative ABC transport system permease protein
MIAKIAWRNVWRSRLRSGVVIFAIMAGIWAGVSMTSMSVGMTEARTKDMIDNFLSHIQIHNPLFKADNKVQHTIQDLDTVEDILQKEDSVVAYAKRAIFREGLLASSKGNRNMKIVGINPDDERAVSTLFSKTVAGN